jgi:hypothetical protein
MEEDVQAGTERAENPSPGNSPPESPPQDLTALPNNGDEEGMDEEEEDKQKEEEEEESKADDDLPEDPEQEGTGKY